MALLHMSHAFNTVYQDKLVEVLQEALRSEQTTAIMLLFGNTQARVKINRTHSARSLLTVVFFKEVELVLHYSQPVWK